MCLAVPVRDNNSSARSVRESDSRGGSFTASNSNNLSSMGPSKTVSVPGEPAGAAVPPCNNATVGALSENDLAAAGQHRQPSGADVLQLGSPARQSSAVHQPHPAGGPLHVTSSSANQQAPNGQAVARPSSQGPSGLALPSPSQLLHAHFSAASSYSLAPSPGSSILGSGSPHRMDSSSAVFPAAASPGTIRGGSPGGAQPMGVEAVHAATMEATAAAAVVLQHVRVASPQPGSSHTPAGWQQQQSSPRSAARHVPQVGCRLLALAHAACQHGPTGAAAAAGHQVTPACASPKGNSNHSIGGQQVGTAQYALTCSWGFFMCCRQPLV